MKILCLGNNTMDTDVQTSLLAKDNNKKSYGLLSELGIAFDFTQKLQDGYYHSSIYDFPQHLLELTNMFDKVVFIDQPMDEWSHPNAYTDTLRILKNTTADVCYLGETSVFEYWKELLEKNKSICVYPFMAIILNKFNTHSIVCCRSAIDVEPLNTGKINFNSIIYQQIRNMLINGEKIPHCQSCYKLEDKGIISARQYETMEWVSRLNLQTIDDMYHLSPQYYEIRTDNICNLMCRTCNSVGSNLIMSEYQSLGISDLNVNKNIKIEYVDIFNISKLYIAGGEPLISNNVYDFLKKCCDNNCTNFELVINTNMVSIPRRVKKIISQFSNIHFIASIDAFGELNYYIRYPAKWSKIVKNLEYAYNNGMLSFNITISIYNVGYLFPLYSFLNDNYPTSEVHCQIADEGDSTFSVYNHPSSEFIIDDLIKCNNLAVCKNNEITMSLHNSLISYFASRSTINDITAFVEFNNKLDKSRNIYLQDYNKKLSKFICKM